MLAWWEGSELTLAIDPTAKGDQLVALVISVVYRGLAIPVTWRIKPGGRHPYLRYDWNMTFQATTGPRWPAWRFVAREGQYTVTAGQAFHERIRSSTLIGLWVPGQECPWVVLTDEAPDHVDFGAYGLRVLIEQGFRTPGAWAGRGTAPDAQTPPASTAT